MFLDSIILDFWDYVLNGPFVPTHYISNEVMHKLRKLWTIEDKEKVQQSYKSNYLRISVLITKEYNYVLYCNTVKYV